MLSKPGYRRTSRIFGCKRALLRDESVPLHWARTAMMGEGLAMVKSIFRLALSIVLLSGISAFAQETAGDVCHSRSGRKQACSL